MNVQRALLIASMLFGIASASAYVAAQHPRPTFKSGLGAVPIFATVTDTEHRLVRTLTAQDFVVLDNGKPQPITVFDNSAVPITVVVLLDDSLSMTDAVERMRDAAQRFILRLRSGDRAELAAFNHTIRFARPFTDDETKLMVSLVTLPPVGPGTMLWQAIDESIAEFRGVEGRKVILLLTDGVDFGSRITARDATKRARDNNVIIYAVTLETEYRWHDKVLRSHPDPALAAIADETGGGDFALTDTADLGATFVRVSEELHNQYTLGFEAQRLDGKVHKLDIRMVAPGLRARGRRSYVATAGASLP